MSDSGPLRASYRRREDDEAMVKRFRFHAEQGEAKAQYLLGVQYSSGTTVPKDYIEAVKWFCKAAEQGYPQAQYMLALCYANGNGVSKNEEEAVRWYRKAAEQGNARAQNELAFCYYTGRGVDKDDEQSLWWDRKAAEQGDGDAQFNLGLCYSSGDGVPKNDEEGVRWYRKAAEQGIARAQCKLAFCYETGRGVTKDEDEAIRWYRKAADSGDKEAQEHLCQLRARNPVITLKISELVFTQVRALMTGEIGVGRPKMAPASSFGDGMLSRAGIMKAVNIMVAYQYWCRNVTKADLQQWPEWLDTVSVMGTSVLLSICPDSLFDDLSDVKEDSSEYADRSHKLFCKIYDLKDDAVKVETVKSLAHFLTSLDIWKPASYWKAVYSRLGLEMPKHDPDRFHPDKRMFEENAISLSGERDQPSQNSNDALSEAFYSLCAFLGFVFLCWFFYQMLRYFMVGS